MIQFGFIASLHVHRYICSPIKHNFGCHPSIHNCHYHRLTSLRSSNQQLCLVLDPVLETSAVKVIRFESGNSHCVVIEELEAVLREYDIADSQ